MDQETPTVKANFTPTKTRLEEITRLGSELLSDATDEELGDFEE